MTTPRAGASEEAVPARRFTRRAAAGIGTGAGVVGAVLGAFLAFTWWVPAPTVPAQPPPPPIILVQPNRGGNEIYRQPDSCPPAPNRVSSSEMDDIEHSVQEWTEVVGVPRAELERRRSELLNWQKRLEQTAEQLLGCDAEEDIRRARGVLKVVKFAAEIIASTLAQPRPTPSPS